MPKTCSATRLQREARRWCDLPPGHGGDHVSYDDTGRPAYAWREAAEPSVISIPWQTRQTRG